MRRKLSTLALAIAAAIPLLSACSSARMYAQSSSTRDRSDRDNSEKPFTWSGAVREGRWVYVRNLNGQVRVEQGTGNKVEITAEKHWRRGNPEDVRIVVRQTGSGDGDVIVCALWNDRSSCDEDGYHSRGDNGWFHNNDRNDVSVEFVVRLPAGVKVDASSVNGGVDIDGATSTVVARTVNGSISARSTGGSVSARTTNGDVMVHAASLDGDHTEYQTVNGTITVELPSLVNADVDMRTVNGHLSSDFPLTVEGSFSPRRLHATLGKGGPTLRLSTVNGSIRLRKLS
jgi:Putative adhesin